MHLVLSTYRSGSTWFCKELAKTHGVKNYDELFRQELISEHDDSIDMLERNPEGVLKLFPCHIQDSTVKNLLERCIKISKTITILVRKNFEDQLQSYYIAHFTGNYHESFNQKIKLNKFAYFKLTKFLNDENIKLSKIYKSLPNSKLVFLEDLSDVGKYSNRVVEWDKLPEKTNIDTIRLFA